MERLNTGGEGKSSYSETYEELRVLGRGSDGVAHLVRHRKSNDLFVAKKLNLGDVGTDTERVKCHNEVKVLASLACPFIVGYQESFEEDGSFFIIMEYAEDGSLQDQIRARKEAGQKFETAEIVDIVHQLLQALHYIHAKKILHRDLKTGNIFMSREKSDSFTAYGEEGGAGSPTGSPLSRSSRTGRMVKLGDFGVARVLGSETSAARTVVGTPYFMSPELISGDPYNEKSDMWALGCVMYELCSLDHAFPGNSLCQVVLAINGGQYSPLAEAVHPNLRQLVDMILVREPSARPSAEELLQSHLLEEACPGTLSLVAGGLHPLDGDTFAAVYDEMKTIGAGSFGRVYLVRRRQDSMLLAAKKIPVDDLGDWKERGKCHNEVRVLASLHCPVVISYVESFEEKGLFFIVTEYAEDGALSAYLHQRLKKGSPLSAEEVGDLFVQLALALEHIHSKKILHRDLKPENVFLSHVADQHATRAGPLVLKLGDFGVSRVLSTKTLQANTVVGTPYYMSPEVVSGKPYAQMSDLWSLGCILYELITLKKAFKRDSLPQVVFSIVQAKYDPLPEETPPHLHNLVEALMCKDPAARPTIPQLLEIPQLAELVPAIEGKLAVATMRSDSIRTPAAHTPMVSKASPRPGGGPAPAPYIHSPIPTPSRTSRGDNPDFGTAGSMFSSVEDHTGSLHTAEMGADDEYLFGSGNNNAWTEAELGGAGRSSGGATDVYASGTYGTAQGGFAGMSLNDSVKINTPMARQLAEQEAAARDSKIKKQEEMKRQMEEEMRAYRQEFGP